jgi:hypothetical protein
MDDDPARGRAANLARRYRREILAVVLIKLGLLLLAHHLWFSHPLAPHMRVERAQVEQQMLGSPAGPVPALPDSAIPRSAS